jgi:hypothetical protein
MYGGLRMSTEKQGSAELPKAPARAPANHATVSVTLSLGCIEEILGTDSLAALLSIHYPRDLRKLKRQLALAGANAASVQYVPKSTGVLTIEQRVKRGLATPEEEAAYWESTI